MSIERIEKAEKRVKTVEDAIVLLTALTDSHNDQLENFLFGLEELRANQKNTDEKLNALINAQIVTEDKLSALNDAQIVTEDKLQRFEAEMRQFRDTNQKQQEKSEKGFAELRATMQDLAEYMKLVHQRMDKIEEKKSVNVYWEHKRIKNNFITQ